MFSQAKIDLGAYTPRQSILFGVELELCVCDGYGAAFYGKDEEYMRDIFPMLFYQSTGISVVFFDNLGIHWSKKSDDYSDWIVMRDGSIKCSNTCIYGPPEVKFHALELVSPILEYTDAGLRILEGVSRNLVGDFRFEINQSQGLHVNLSYYGQEQDTVNGDFTIQKYFFLAWYHFEPEILSYIAKYRHEAIREFAYPLTREFKDEASLSDEFDKTIYDKLNDVNAVWPDKYSAVNVKKDRFEVRIPESKPRKEHILTWVNLCCKFLRACLEGRNYLDYKSVSDFTKFD